MNAFIEYSSSATLSFEKTYQSIFLLTASSLKAACLMIDPIEFLRNKLE